MEEVERGVWEIPAWQLGYDDRPGEFIRVCPVSERDEARAEHETTERSRAMWMERAEAAEARIEQLEGALERIAELRGALGHGRCAEIAREALASTPQPSEGEE